MSPLVLGLLLANLSRVSVGNFVFKLAFRLKQPEVISSSDFHHLTQDSSGQGKFLLDRENILPLSVAVGQPK